jgi:hypothetical protein
LAGSAKPREDISNVFGQVWGAAITGVNVILCGRGR